MTDTLATLVEVAQRGDTPRRGGNVSVEDDRLDRLVQQASVPSLSSLFQRAKDAGVIGAVTIYGGPPV